MADRTLTNIGLYSVPEASALTGQNAPSIHRWLKGYRRKEGNTSRQVRSVLNAELGEVDGKTALTFLDLMEIRMIAAFRQHGVSWQAIRAASALACDMFGDSHPFSMQRFKTDGKTIFAELFNDGTLETLDLNKKNFVFSEVVEPSLFASLEFEDGQAARWFPKNLQKKVVLDPKRSFGHPVLSQEGIPTAILANAALVEGSVKSVASWYEIPVGSVKAAVEFEQRLAA